MTVWSIYGQFFGYVRTAFKLESLNRLFFDVRMSPPVFFFKKNSTIPVLNPDDVIARYSVNSYA